MYEDDKFYKVVEENERVDTLILIKERTVRPVNGGQIVKSSEEGVTVKVTDGDVLRIGKYLYIWIAAKKVFEIQC